MRTDYLGLEALIAIAEFGSFGRAATYLNLSKTALSHRIRKLESNLGVRLLVRTTREVSLTKEAQALLPQVRGELRRVSHAFEELRSGAAKTGNSLTFACLPTFSNYYLPEILESFSKRNPSTAIELHDVPFLRIYEMVEAAEVEFGISIVGAKRWDLHVQEILTEPYVLLVRRNHPLARKKSVSRADLAGHAFVRIQTQSSNRQLVDEALGSVSESIIWRYQVRHISMAMSLVAQGAALTVLPALTASLSGTDIKALPFNDMSAQRTLGVVTRRGSPLSPPAEDLLKIITSRLAKQPGGQSVRSAQTTPRD